MAFKKIGNKKVTKATRSKGNTMSAIAKEALNTDVKSVGSYVKPNSSYSKAFSGKQVKGLTRSQSYKLEKNALKNERMKISSKPETIRAIGQAIAMNTTGAQGGLAMGITNSMNNAQKNATQNQNTNKSVNELIDGGVNFAGKDNEEEENSLPEYVVR